MMVFTRYENGYACLVHVAQMVRSRSASCNGSRSVYRRNLRPGVSPTDLGKQRRASDLNTCYLVLCKHCFCNDFETIPVVMLLTSGQISLAISSSVGL